ncbi:MAG: hypothetical protein IPM98_14760 [Lewinellaceae bacterium]|nr:hypothetical protein [Lewinellaceae bacterium]
MKKKDELHDELNEHAPFLREFKKADDGFQVPDGYFESVEDSVFRQLEAIGATRHAPAPKHRPSLWQVLQSLWQPRIALAFAGVLAVAFSAWWLFRPATDGTTDSRTHLMVSAEDAESYLLENPMQLEPEDLAAAFPEGQLPAITLENGGSNTPGEAVRLAPEDLELLLRDMTDEELGNLHAL